MVNRAKHRDRWRWASAWSLSGIRISLCVMLALLMLPAFLGIGSGTASAADTGKKLVYDEAGLLEGAAVTRLEALAHQLGAERETDILVITSANPNNEDVMRMTQDFYDRVGPGYDKSHGNAVLLMLDMRNREIYLAGFYKGKEYLDDRRLDRIRSRISTQLTNGNYESAFEAYIRTAHRYLGVRPGVDPDNILFQLWFQLAVSLGAAGLVVGIMAFNSGGRVTVHRGTYENPGRSGVLNSKDQYIRTTTTKTRIPKNTGGGGGGRGGGGGGTTRGGHSHSGSRGSF